MTMNEWLEKHYAACEFGIPGGVFSGDNFSAAGVVWMFDNPAWVVTFYNDGRVSVLPLAVN